MKTSTRNLLTIAAGLVLSAPRARAADPDAEPTTIHIGGGGGWDYARVDSDAHRLYVTRFTHM